MATGTAVTLFWQKPPFLLSQQSNQTFNFCDCFVQLKVEVLKFLKPKEFQIMFMFIIEGGIGIEVCKEEAWKGSLQSDVKRNC